MANPATTGRFMSHGWVVVASLFCGLGVWLVVQLTERASITLELPVRPTETLDQHIALQLLRETVPVTFSYPATEIARMNADNFEVVVEFQDLIKRMGDRLEAEGDTPLTKSMVQSINEIDMERLNIAVTDIAPQVSWEAEIRNLPAVIEPVVIGEPAPGYTYDPAAAIIEEEADIRVMLDRPTEIRLRSEGVETITLRTEPVDVSGASAPVREIRAIEFPPGISLLPTDTLDTRTVSVDIVERTETRTIENVPVTYELLSARDDLRAIVEPDAASVTVEGKVTELEKLDADMFTFGIEYVVERPGERREVAIEPRFRNSALSRDFRILEVTPRSVTVTIESTAPPETAAPTPTPRPTPRPTPDPTTPPTVASDDEPTT